MTSVWEDPENSLKKAGVLIRHAADCGAQLICFPEQFATGWDPGSGRHMQDSNGSIVTTLKAYATENSISIVGSFREQSDPFPKNTAVVIGSNGSILATYSKIHLFSPAGEDTSFMPGTELGIFSIGSLTCGLAICYDLRFPSLFRIYAQMGVQAVFVPAAWPPNRIKHWELFIAARAAENQMYVIGVNTTGTTPVDKYSGASMTADMHGSVIQRASDAEQLLFSDLEPSLVDATRHAFPVEKDRKDALYHTLLTRKIV
jgi:predicted amidohydrolase